MKLDHYERGDIILFYDDECNSSIYYYDKVTKDKSNDLLLHLIDFKDRSSASFKRCDKYDGLFINSLNLTYLINNNYIQENILSLVSSPDKEVQRLGVEILKNSINKYNL